MAWAIPEELKKPKVLLIGGAGLVAVWFVLRPKATATGTTASTTAADTSGLVPLDQLPPQALQLSNPNTGGQPAVSAPPPTPQPQITFAQALGSVLPGVYSQSGFAGGPTDSAAGAQDLFNTLGQFGTGDTGYQDWLAQTKAASAGGQVAQFHQLLIQGEQYGGQFGTETVTPIGTQKQFATTAAAAPAAGATGATGGGGFSVGPMPHGPYTDPQQAAAGYLDQMRESGILPGVRASRKSLRMYGDLLMSEQAKAQGLG